MIDLLYRTKLVPRVLLFCALLMSARPGICAEVFSAATPVNVPRSSSSKLTIPALTAEEIFSRLTEANSRRFRELKGFTGWRNYSLEYRGFPSNRDAGIVVKATYTAPTMKHFVVVSESGSKWMQHRVLRKLLESEKEAADPENQRRTAMTPENYSLTLIGTSASEQGGCYRMKVEPRHDYKFLYRGEICVNANDFAIESIDAEPAKNPSFWISKTRIEQRYAKVGVFWLPVSNKSYTSVRLGGLAVLTIEYKDYRLQ